MSSFYIESISFRPYPRQFKEFRSSKNGPIGRDLMRRGRMLQALAKGSVNKRTGALAASIYLNYHTALNPYITVGSRMRYALYVHEGTSPHTIRSRGRVMRFVVNGRVIYATKVNHPGTRAQKYLSRHLRTVVR